MKFEYYITFLLNLISAFLILEADSNFIDAIGLIAICIGKIIAIKRI